MRAELKVKEAANANEKPESSIADPNPKKHYIRTKWPIQSQEQRQKSLRMQAIRSTNISFFLTLIAISAPFVFHQEVEIESTSKKNASASETRIRRAVFDLIPDTGGDAHRQKGRCVEGRKCGSTQKKLNPGHGGTFASYRRFIGRHSKGQRRSRRKLKMLFLDWLKEERERMAKHGRWSSVSQHQLINLW